MLSRLAVTIGAEDLGQLGAKGLGSDFVERILQIFSVIRMTLQAGRICLSQVGGCGRLNSNERGENCKSDYYSSRNQQVISEVQNRSGSACAFFHKLTLLSYRPINLPVQSLSSIF